MPDADSQKGENDPSITRKTGKKVLWTEQAESRTRRAWEKAAGARPQAMV
jgi:hypothetical protein